MKRVLICPANRPEVPLLSAEAPLALTPALGYGMVEYWMSHLVCAGVREVVLLESDRPDDLQKAVGSGSRWGVTVEVKNEPLELTAEQASQKYGAPASVMDHFPGIPDAPVFSSYKEWYNALILWMRRAKTPDRVGVRELRPGIWAGLRGHISREARLCAPCWLGDHVYVGPGAVIGPGTVLEDGAFIEPDVEIRDSIIGPSTFVGRYMNISQSLAWGDTLVNWQTSRENKIHDAFLLCSLHPRRTGVRAAHLLDRVAEWLARWKEDPPLDPPMQTQPAFIKKGS